MGLSVAATSVLVSGCTAAEFATIGAPILTEIATIASDSVLGKGKKGGILPDLADIIFGNESPTGGTPPPPGAPGTPGKMLLAIYLIGSDLEDGGETHTGGRLNKDGAGTSDLNEIREAYMALAPEKKANIDVFVAFGGARQTGWQGVKYIDIDGIVKDGADGYYGNADASTYLKSTDGANMGDPNVLKAFLTETKARKAAQGSARTFLTMWDHGGAYGGVGPDSTTEAVLSNAQQRDALAATGFSADIIGYDACLMASVEVVAAVKDYGNYLLASEELEPGHGWDYTQVVAAIAQDPNRSVADIGKAAVDSFIDSPRHASTNGRTLSLVNLRQADGLLQALDSFGNAYQGKLAQTYQGLLDAAGEATPYGSEGQRGDEVSVDLHGFVSAVKTQAPGPEAETLLNAIKNSVVYSRHDGSKPGSFGLSIYSLQNLGTFQNQGYNRDNAVPGNWFGLVQSFMGLGANDTESPKVALRGNPSGYHLMSNHGYNMHVSDNVGVEDVDTVHAVMPDPNGDTFVVVSEVPQSEVETNTYFMPDWDGRSLHLNDGAGARVIVPTYEVERVKGYTILSADGQLNGEDVVYYFELDGNQQVVDYWATPVEEDGDANQVVDKDQYVIENGDRVAFYQRVVDIRKDEERYDLTRVIRIAGEPDFSWQAVSGAGFFFTSVNDQRGNVQNSEIREVGQTEPSWNADGGEWSGTFEQSDD
ncbi:Clostripain family protein [compost metagenome]